MIHRPDAVTSRIALSFFFSVAAFASISYILNPAGPTLNRPNGPPIKIGQILMFLMFGFNLYGTPIWVLSFLGLKFLTPRPMSRAAARFAGPGHIAKPDELEELPKAREEAPPPRANIGAVLGLAAAFAAVGFLVTPFAIVIIGLSILSNLSGYSSQGQGFGLTLAGMAATIPGATFWGMFGSGWAARDPKAGFATSWWLALAMYGVGVMSVIGIVWLSFL